MDDRPVFPTIPWVSGTPAGVRTLDTLIKSQVLYQLSYGCMSLECGCKGTAFF